MKMVEIKSPVCLRDIESRLGILFKLLMAEGLKKELFDTDKLVAINLKKEESVALMDRNDNLWEIFRNKKGRYSVRRLGDRKHGT